MKFESPTTLPAALGLLAQPGARCLAGGQSLGAMMNAQLVEPELLVSLRKIPELQAIEVLPGKGVRLGAMTTYRAVAGMDVTSGTTDLAVRAIPLIAHPPIRNQGTVGGSICHADPAGDFPTIVTCADATIRIAHPGGVREVAARDFFHGYFETAVQPGELVVSIDLPDAPAGTCGHYEKFMLTEGDFAAASVAAIIGWNGSACSFVRLAVGACAPGPVRLTEAEELLLGSALDDDTLRRAGELLVGHCDPVDDFRASREYRLKLIPRLLRRAVLAARARTEPTHD